MDQEKTGEITAQECYTLVLGMGIDVRRADLDALILQHNDGKLNHISLEVVLKLFEKVSRVSLQLMEDMKRVCLTRSFITFSHLSQFERRDNREELDRAFELIVKGGDSSNNNKINPHHLVKLSEDVGEPVSLEQAQAMMQNWNGQWSKADLERILSSPSSTASGNL